MTMMELWKRKFKLYLLDSNCFTPQRYACEGYDGGRHLEEKIKRKMNLHLCGDIFILIQSLHAQCNLNIL